MKCEIFISIKWPVPDEVPDDLATPESGTQPDIVRASMRHPIYVHSKMTIVDDDYILVHIILLVLPVHYFYSQILNGLPFHFISVHFPASLFTHQNLFYPIRLQLCVFFTFLSSTKNCRNRSRQISVTTKPKVARKGSFITCKILLQKQHWHNTKTRPHIKSVVVSPNRLPLMGQTISDRKRQHQSAFSRRKS